MPRPNVTSGRLSYLRLPSRQTRPLRPSARDQNLIVSIEQDDMRERSVQVSLIDQIYDGVANGRDRRARKAPRSRPR
jgi:hypothetical protein